ncbi:MAG TPA: penicillin-binding transpeptidase domain-containing protein, partial [Pusillimonas sp.]|uniref:penicillin-binding protein 1A n=1 Tax=Pusillimonas sp. TaxID=3040095 RepID=UPI002B5FC2B9
YTRKFYELLLTFKIEATLSKDQILDLYMNQIFLGHRAYGFAAAARTYFGKQLSDITPAEAAMLAGIPKAPSRFNPIANMPRAKSRQAYVLGRMQHLGYLTEAEYQEAMQQPIVLKSAPGTPAGGYAIHGEYVAELARRLLYSVYQDNVYSRGFNIYTTIHSKDQEAAYNAVREGILQYTRRAVYPGPEETVRLPDGLENDAAALDTLLDELQDKYPDSGDLITALVLSASPEKITVARSSQQIIEITNKDALKIVARGLGKNAKEPHRISRGSVVYVHKNGDHWEVLNRPSVQAAFVSLRPQDGAILSLVGGFDFEEQFNRVTQAWRQPGSAFKPFIYAAALERGLTPATQVSDEPFMLTAAQTGSKAWSPKNYGGNYEPMLTMRQGLYKSKNMVSIRIMQAVGPKYVQDYITRFGFDRSRNPAVLPLALGAGGVTPLQLAGGFAVFANGGYRVPPYLIDQVTDASGKVIMQARPTVAGDAAARAIDPRTAYVMNDMLRGVATSGTGARASATLKRRDIGGKTGTTNDSHDAWFAGFTPKLVGVAWMGFDQPRSLGSRETGGGASMPIWVDYMRVALEDTPEIPLGDPPAGLARIDGDYYFSEFPPGQAVARVGLPTPDEFIPFDNGGGGLDGIGNLLEQLSSGGAAGEAAQVQRVQF